MKFKFIAQTQQGPKVVEIEGDSLQDVYNKIEALGYKYDGTITFVEED